LSNIRGLAVDLKNNELLVLNGGAPPSVNVYSRTASGNTAPLNALTGPATGLNSPGDLALDFTNLEGGPGVGVLYVANLNSVTAYLWPTAGNAAPFRTLSGPATQLTSPSGLAVDLANDELVVVNSDLATPSVTVYGRTASGNTSPRRILAGATTLGAPYRVAVTASAVAVDHDSNGDGKTDILRRHTSGALIMSLMNGASVVGSADSGIVPPDWTIVAIGDFNGDRRAGLLLRHASGVVSIWFIDGTRVIATGSPSDIDTGWQIQ